MKLREHQVTLQGERVVLRPMTEQDWDLLVKWNNNPAVLYYAEGDDVSSYSREQVQAIYRGVSQKALCFIIQVEGQSIGECWLQQMNLERILQRHPGLDCRRIDLMIGEKAHWGRGLGTEVIRLLTRFAFESEQADRVFGCDIADDNPASLKAFQKVGYQVLNKIEQSPGDKARHRYDLVLAKEQYR